MDYQTPLQQDSQMVKIIRRITRKSDQVKVLRHMALRPEKLMFKAVYITLNYSIMLFH
jgi:hypothetical protein